MRSHKGRKWIDGPVLHMPTLALGDLTGLLVQLNPSPIVCHLLVNLSSSFTLLNIVPDKLIHRQLTHKETLWVKI